MREWNGRKYYTKSENLQFYSDLKNYNRMRLAPGVKHLGALLLDSSLIFATPKATYTHKIVQCGNYYQVYNYNKKTTKKNSDTERMNFINTIQKKKSRSRVEENQSKKTVIIVEEDSKYQQLNLFGKTEPRMKILKKIVLEKPDFDLYFNNCFLNWSKYKTSKDPPNWLYLNEEYSLKENPKIIMQKNIVRAKIELERLVKSNVSIFKTFITLTIADNLTDISLANKKLAVWRTKVQSVLKKQKKEFSYVCVPEFQKRGAVHYHLLTNLDVENSEIIIPQKEFTEKQMQEMTPEQRCHCYDVKYWNHGFSSVQTVEEIQNVVGYISKYMTKDIDNRLWGKRRYLSSHNLKRPSTLFIDSADDRGFLQLLDIKNNCESIFESIYSNPLGEVIEFQELKRKEVI